MSGLHRVSTTGHDTSETPQALTTATSHTTFVRSARLFTRKTHTQNKSGRFLSFACTKGGIKTANGALKGAYDFVLMFDSM